MSIYSASLRDARSLRLNTYRKKKKTKNRPMKFLLRRKILVNNLSMDETTLRVVVHQWTFFFQISTCLASTDLNFVLACQSFRSIHVAMPALHCYRQGYGAFLLCPSNLFFHRCYPRTCNSFGSWNRYTRHLFFWGLAVVLTTCTNHSLQNWKKW